MVVIGNGLLARAFNGVVRDDTVTIFASGVSNSGQITPSEFERERALLKSHIGTKRRLVYFSTLSVFDPSLQASPYIVHKKRMEAAVRETFPEFTVFRLPNLVGNTPNPHTLTNYIRDRIVKGETLRVLERARRHLVDVEHASTICSQMILDDSSRNQSLNIHFDRPIDIPALVKIFERILGRTAVTESVDAGGEFQADNSIVRRFLRAIRFEVADHYNEEVIEKYYGRRAGEPGGIAAL